MKKLTKTLVAIFLIAVLSMTSVTAFASNEGPSPRLSHTSHGGFVFAATDNVGYIDVSYYGYDSFVRADDFKDAVYKAKARAKEGENVLLSPACASFDMFADYEQRGRVFKQIVNEM